MQAFVQARLDEKWSPEQIANILRLEFPDRPEMYASHETIYRALYAQPRGDLWREISRRLRTGRSLRKRRRRPRGAQHPLHAARAPATRP
nr:hypothetical protein [Streptomyces calvus]